MKISPWRRKIFPIINKKSHFSNISVPILTETTYLHKEDVPDSQFLIQGTHGDIWNNPEEYIDIVVESLLCYYYTYILSTLLSPKSRGFISLNESDLLYDRARTIYPRFY